MPVHRTLPSNYLSGLTALSFLTNNISGSPKVYPIKTS